MRRYAQYGRWGVTLLVLCSLAPSDRNRVEVTSVSSSLSAPPGSGPWRAVKTIKLLQSGDREIIRFSISAATEKGPTFSLPVRTKPGCVSVVQRDSGMAAIVHPLALSSKHRPAHETRFGSVPPTQGVTPNTKLSAV